MAFESTSSTPFFVAFFFLLICVTLTRSHVHDQQDPFKFLQHLEGCHKGQNVTGLHELKTYLNKFGYYLNSNPSGIKTHNNKHANDDEFDETLETAIKSYQQNYRLQVTGTLDTATVKQMMVPRCGVPDVVVNGTSKKYHKMHKGSIHGVRHYELYYPGPLKWPAEKTHLTYRFVSSVPQAQLTADTQNVKSVCAKAFQKWGQVTRFTFEEVPADSAADITIGFHRGSHGNEPSRNRFDGRFGTFAHANPPTGGNFHYDADENWSVNPGPDGLDLESVTVHEIGHLLGLDHNPGLPEAIMYPYFEYGITKRELNRDDINGIRALYGLQ